MKRKKKVHKKRQNTMSNKDIEDELVDYDEEDAVSGSAAAAEGKRSRKDRTLASIPLDSKTSF